MGYLRRGPSLARQRGDWESIVSLGNEAQANGLAPFDAIEWMPFLQAYALTGNVDRLTELAPTISADPYVSLQVCRIPGGVQGLSDSVIEVVDSEYGLE